MDRRAFVRRGAGVVAGSALAGVGEAAAAPAQFPGRGPAGERDDAFIGLRVDNLSANLETVRALAGGRPVMAVVKANAYGHGLVQVAQVLAGAGVDSFMVGNSREAVQLREAGIEAPILNFGKVYEGAADAIIEHGIEQMVDSREAISQLVPMAAWAQSEVRVHVHIDTGLGRMGVPWGEALELLEYVHTRSRFHIAGVCTAFTEDPDFDRVQLERFLGICDAATAAGIDVGRRHAASSAALMDFPEAHLDMVRPGIALYGHYPSDTARARYPEVQLKPVLNLRARVAAVRRLQPGDSVGYHRVHTATEPETIAVLPVGYSDGYPPEAAQQGGGVWIDGVRCPLVAAVSANHCMVRVPDDLGVEPGALAVMIATGDETVGFGASAQPADPATLPLADDLVARTGFSPYRLHIGLNPGLPRRIEGGRRRF